MRAEGWDEFVERLAGVIGDIEPRRRQALVMLLFALLDGQLDPAAATAWIDEHDLDRDEDVTAMIAWLRRFRPAAGEELPEA